MSAQAMRQVSPFDASVVSAAAPTLAATTAASAQPSSRAPAKATAPTARKARRAAPPSPSPATPATERLPAEPLGLDEDGPLNLTIPSDAWFLDLEPLSPEDEALYSDRPRSRQACVNGPRPCPWISCRHHLWAEVAFVPRRKLYRWRNDAPAPWEMAHTCALDVADEGGITLEDVGKILGLTRERVRQLEAQALQKLARFFSPEDRASLLEHGLK
jgi:hypothetical protein